MIFGEIIRIALRALTVNKLRSLLTMLGIIIGISTATVLISAGQAVERYIYELFAGIGTNVLFVVPGQLTENQDPTREPQFGELTYSDARALSNPLLVPDMVMVAPEANANATIVRGDEAREVALVAIAPQHKEINGWDTQIGEFFSQADMDSRRRVAILGQTAFQSLYEPNENPLDTQIRVNGVVFTVVGVMSEIGIAQFGNRDDSVFLPFTTAMDRVLDWKTTRGDYKVTQILVSVSSEDRMDQAQIDIEEALRERHRIDYFEEDDFSVISQTDFISVFGDITAVVTVFLGAISFVSLLVGGIGIMNIMLVSVAERTREIGLRKAIGARRRDILQQFLAEAVFLSVMGGICGMVLGALVMRAADSQITALQLTLQVSTVAGVVAFCMATGILFGFWPAVQASRLSPISALRSE